MRAPAWGLRDLGLIPGVTKLVVWCQVSYLMALKNEEEVDDYANTVQLW